MMTPMIRQAVILLSAADGRDAFDEAERPVAGLSMVHRIVLSLARAGIARALLVGPDDPTRGGALADDPRFQREDITVEYVGVETAGDGALVYLHEHLAGAPFLLCRAHRIHEISLLRALAAVDLGTSAEPSADIDVAAIATASDSATDAALHDPTLAWGIRAEAGRVVAVRSQVEDDDAPDCGLLALAPGLLDHLVENGGSLQQALQHFAEAGRVAAVATDGRFWSHIASPAIGKRAEKELIRRLAKTSDGPILQLVNRRISRRITSVLMHTSATPNQLTIFASLVGFVGIFCVFQATWLWLAIGAVLMEVQMTLDCCDGEIARLKFNGSRFGEWLDTVMDDVLNLSYALSLGWASKELLGEPAYWWLAWGAVGAYLVYDAVLYTQLMRVGRGTGFFFRWWFQKEDAYVKESLASSGVSGRLLEFVHSLARRDVFLFGFMLLALARLPHAAVIWFAISGAVHGLLAVVHAAAGGIPPATRSNG